MIEVDNFEEIRKLLHFDMEHVYIVELVLRKKDGNTDAKGNNKNRTIKSYLFQTEKQWDDAQEEIITMCKAFNCRAYISLNRKSVANILLGINNNINERLRQLFFSNVIGNVADLNRMVDSVVMKSSVDSRDERLWVVDVDSRDKDELDEALNCIMFRCSSVYENPVITAIPTAHGIHIITRPFNTRVFKDEYHRDGLYEMPEIKKEALTLLYAYLHE